MKYLIDAVKYSTKNSIKLFVFALMPAFFVGGLLSPYALSNFYAQYPHMVVNNYTSVFSAFFNFNLPNVVLWILGFILLAISLSVTFGLIERHMRTGKFTLSESTTLFNNNILIVLAYMAILAVIYFVGTLLISIILFGMHMLISGLGVVPTTLNVVVSYAVGIILMLVIYYFMMIIFLAIPETISTGYSVPNCIINTNQNLSRKAKAAFVAFVAVLLVHFPLIILSYGHWWRVLVGVLLAFVYIYYFTSLNYIIYFDINGISREDGHMYKFKFFKR